MIVGAGDVNIWFCRRYSGDLAYPAALVAVWAVISLYLALRGRDRTLWRVYLVASLFWTAVELYIQGTGTRTWVAPPVIAGFPVGFPLTALIQGFSEGGVPTAFAFLAARWAVEKRYGFLLCLIVAYLGSVVLYLMQAGAVAAAGDAAVSRRVVSALSIAVVTGGSAAAVIIARRRRQDARFVLLLFLFLCLAGTVINFTAWGAGVRSVERAASFAAGQPAAFFAPATTGVTVLALLYDSIVEFAGIYCAFAVASLGREYSSGGDRSVPTSPGSRGNMVDGRGGIC